MRPLTLGWMILLLGCEAEPRAFSKVSAQGEATLPGLETSEAVAAAHPSFDKYWYRGKAELNRYDLQQSRYGALHKGEAVLIFVTEDFLKTKHVKFEGKGDAKDAASVLKLNSYRRFYTGVYPYTLMTSVFSLAKEPRELPLKLTFSATEWCGQVFMQLNQRAGQFHVQERSYFEAEGDRDTTLPVALIEDGLWTRVRQDPSTLPVGRIELLPAAHHVRLDHVPLKLMAAHASLGAEQNGKRTYRVKYDAGRELALTFETRFPHRITSFEEKPKSGAPVTRGTLSRSIMLPYWEKHGPDDGAYRKALGLTE